MQVTLARAASGVATKRHWLGPAGEVVTEGYPPGESRWALYRRDLPDLLTLVGTMREIPMDTCFFRGEPAPFVPPEHHFAPVVALILIGFGSEEEHAAAVATAREALQPLFDVVSPMPYVALQRMLDLPGETAKD